MKNVIVIGLMVVCIAIGCNKGKGSGNVITLKDSKIKVEVPKDAKVEGDLENGYSITNKDLLLKINESGILAAGSAKEAIRSVQSHQPKNMKSEELSDGWMLVYDGPLGDNFFVKSRRQLGDIDVICSTMTTTPKQQENAVIACKSLKM
jgi:hypothetical protein